MGIREKWLVKKICKQALKENKDLSIAAKTSYERINSDLLPINATDRRKWRVFQYLLETWEELTNEEFPVDSITETETK